MNDLGSDAQISILKNLKGNEIIKVCQTSRRLQRVCKDERFDSLWKLKILEEFNLTYNGKNAFRKYEELKFLYRQEFYELIILSGEVSDAFYIFDTFEKAVFFLHQILATDYDLTFNQIETGLKDGQEIVFNSNGYRIIKRRLVETHFDPDLIHKYQEDMKQAYEEKRKLYGIMRESEVLDMDQLNDSILQQSIDYLNKRDLDYNDIEDIIEEINPVVTNLTRTSFPQNDEVKNALFKFLVKNIWLSKDKVEKLLEE